MIMHRVFIAIDIEDDIRQAIYDHTREVFKGIGHIRVVPPENLHITLKFIGDVDEEKMARITRITGESAANHKDFEYLMENRMGAFPGIEKAEIAFIGLREGAGKVKEVFNSLEQGLAEEGIKKEKRSFIPHITVARIKRPFNIEEAASVPFGFRMESMAVGSVTVYESILSRHGAKYINIGRFGLK